MSFSVGIVGLPNAGKSTLFKSLTKKQVEIAPYPFTTINPNIGIVSLEDKRLYELAKIIKPERITPTTIEFIDIAGLVKGAYKGEGLGNQFLSQIRNCNAVLEITRAFLDTNIQHPAGEVDPKKDIEIIKTELLMKDLETLENVLPKLEKDAKIDKKAEKKFNLLKHIKEVVSKGELVSKLNLREEEKELIKEYQFLTAKPFLYIINFNKEDKPSPFQTQRLKETLVLLPPNTLLFNLKLEEELTEFSEEDGRQLRNGFASPLESVVGICYNILDLISFFTVAGGKEVKAWTLKKGLNVLEAAGKVHSDFKEKFTKAEIIPYQKLIEAGSWPKAKESGQIKTVSKEYIVQDGDIIEFKI